MLLSAIIRNHSICGHINITLKLYSTHWLNEATNSLVLLRIQNTLNPFKRNEISHSYQLDQSISILRVVGFFIFIQILIEHSVSKQWTS